MEDENDGLKIDEDMIFKDHTCRLSFFNNLLIPELLDDDGNRIDPATGRILEANRH